MCRRLAVDSYGRVKVVSGLLIESTGPKAKLGEICTIGTSIAPHDVNVEHGGSIVAEVVGFRGPNLLLMPYGEIAGIEAGSVVRASGGCHRVPTGDALLGRVVSALGAPIDGRPRISSDTTYPVLASPPSAMTRQIIREPLSLGVRAIDALLTTGVGQRVGVFAGSGVGKSTLLGMIARGSQADVNVIALVGERGREVREFLENDLGPEGLRRSVVVVSTSDEPSLLRIRAAFTATAIAESFRDNGRNVLLMMDSVTRFAMAQREVGLAIGEPPSTKGYTPSVFAILPKLMERSGNSDKGSITAIYTVLVEGDDINEPIADTARSILDGHIVLSRKLANAGHFPAIDVTASLSRLMPNIVSPEQVSAASKFRELTAEYNDIEDLVSIGAYKPGSKPIADEALRLWPQMNSLLRQDRDQGVPGDQSVAELMELISASV
jgi:flagellum-specific ATP synthase